MAPKEHSLILFWHKKKLQKKIVWNESLLSSKINWNSVDLIHLMCRFVFIKLSLIQPYKLCKGNDNISIYNWFYDTVDCGGNKMKKRRKEKKTKALMPRKRILIEIIGNFIDCHVQTVESHHHIWVTCTVSKGKCWASRQEIPFILSNYITWKCWSTLKSIWNHLHFDMHIQYFVVTWRLSLFLNISERKR